LRTGQSSARQVYPPRVSFDVILDALTTIQTLCPRGWSHQRQLNFLTGQVCASFCMTLWLHLYLSPPVLLPSDG
jgi:hypothetical protein